MSGLFKRYEIRRHPTPLDKFWRILLASYDRHTVVTSIRFDCDSTAVRQDLDYLSKVTKVTVT